ncbi:hypothetical protein ACSFA8_22755 [Variovorax sp. RT4R15]|uniref:hypothetical protein n=1 Tax=Variovorax sp. RT4R15 TaxID=3443737 RepID=UPI003F456DAB
MPRSTSLDLLQQSTLELVAQKLRSESVVIARLSALIQDAVRAGHSHRSIHEAITAGGLATSWTNYRIALGRARKAQRGATPARTSPAPSAALPAALPVALISPVELIGEAQGTSSLPDECGEMGGSTRASPSTGTSSTTHVLDALQRAREVASKDYSRIARENYRQRHRNPPSKDLP